ncbi:MULTISPECIES: type II toxin-antitoxin system Phd/YefM family antitoxin [Thermoanaerobacterium]|jgi:prevent-host-death family protein|uniref:Antitoxin n=1 Tax=Thermoanaerobacterium butyriciformans TaxID=1702242 RepID=A0ABS4ND40_9THEO|nr:type II toxin-antitoxin system Phd/YefM family antitoxin [Thermoanaerobacterium butyriciformans]MBP2070928.1 prevent-host-death family protein [Thermoanaerobacterium butyriciformans]MDK2805177.1 antitoxin YefM [Thermoanaerobacterium sp.]WHE06939.1 type II toxin-antitoxin system Phd/YefM family antitoxin [Thermoanaerobacterium thermosaccharolyticum]
MKIMPVTKVRQNIYKIIEQVKKYREPIQITSRKGNAILISEEDWNAIQETLYLLSIPNLKESIIESDKTPLDEWKDEEDLGWDIN